MKRVLRTLVILVLVVALAGAAGGTYVVRRAFPKTSGRLSVPGLSDPVEVIRDRWGIPHLYAKSARDLFFAQGFVHAQDRLWLESALRDAVRTLDERLGSDRAKWRWGRLHRPTFVHPIGRIKALAWIFNTTPPETGGDAFTSIRAVSVRKSRSSNRLWPRSCRSWIPPTGTGRWSSTRQARADCRFPSTTGTSRKCGREASTSRCCSHDLASSRRRTGV